MVETTQSSAAMMVEQLKNNLGEQILGQPQLVERLLIALLADGHLLVEGAPGLAKTRAIKCLAEMIEGSFHRVQFTPDLLPGDVTGTDVYRPKSSAFEFIPGPIFNNLVLADEINRAPAKVQSALLEAMAERQITVGQKSYELPDLFLVMATQNPIEQEGTYPLPEAQLDRFLLHICVDYPDARVEREILRLAHREQTHDAPPATKISQETLFTAREELLQIHMADAIEEYIVQLIAATRLKADAAPFARHIEFGASPRATIALERCARARAWLSGSDFVRPEDVQAMAHDALRHRLVLSLEAESEGVTPDALVDQLLDYVPVA